MDQMMTYHSIKISYKDLVTADGRLQGDHQWNVD